jgi:enoyl-CoA hydratase
VSDYRQIIYRKEPPIAWVRMNRARYRNAQSLILLEEMDDAFADGVSDDDIKVLIMAAEGDHFSSGHDLGTPETKEDYARRGYLDAPKTVHATVNWKYFVEMGMRWRDLPKPTIAAVQGFCVLGGWMLASQMDIIIAADDALFLPAFSQYFSAPWEMGARKAKEILFQSRFVEAEEALALGMVNQVVPRSELESETRELAGRIAESDPFALRMTKLSINQMEDAMGWRTAMQSAFANYMVAGLSGVIYPPEQREAGKRSLPAADQAVRHLKKKDAKR